MPNRGLHGNKVNNQDITVQVEVSGSIAESLRALGAKMSKEVMVKAARAGAEVITESIAARVPIKTGELINNLGFKIDSSKGNVTATIGFLDDFQASIAWWVEHGHNSREARTAMQKFFKQKGTLKGHVPAHPFFRPGIDAGMKACSEAVVAELTKALEQPSKDKEAVA